MKKVCDVLRVERSAAVVRLHLSGQSNGMAESFVKPMRHDYIAFLNKPDLPTALKHLAAGFEHYNERHLHSALKIPFLYGVQAPDDIANLKVSWCSE
ncbi:Integrase, catalytic region [Collimonas fungivorans Ter331]|uniref:Integrase, catalytic region n=1 Tax=Collimonas fungivorans (strain Ter331) TaxID=1005048 RepID=G0AIZ4_COLFT|nr:Integrase, catalytic region [Collimonas fungivorans Ter331]